MMSGIRGDGAGAGYKDAMTLLQVAADPAAVQQRLEEMSAREDRARATIEEADAKAAALAEQSASLDRRDADLGRREAAAAVAAERTRVALDARAAALLQDRDQLESERRTLTRDMEAREADLARATDALASRSREIAAREAALDEMRATMEALERAAQIAGEYREGDEDGVPDRIEAAIRALMSAEEKPR